MKIFALLLTSVLVFAGCASTPKGDPMVDSKAKNFRTNPNGAYLYVYRNETMGFLYKMDVIVDNQLLGSNGAKNYMWIDLQPGLHKISSVAENTSVVEINVKPGKNYYVWQEVKMGIMSARTNVQQVDEATGQAGVNECSLIQHNQPAKQAMK